MKILREEDKIITQVKNVHMIGIGGSGMCPLAEILHGKGYNITGSDNNEGDTLNRCKSLGIKVFMGHNAENVKGAELVVYSAAISLDNSEIIYAKEHGIPTMERSHLLGAITRMYDNVIGVCGTHGKTSTTSMITQIFILNNLDPTAVIGGKLPLMNSNGRTGQSENMICESCEFVDTFLQLSPDMSVLLNIDNDHLDYFKTMDNLVLSFHKFINMSRVAFINGDDPLVQKAATDIGAEKITFGTGKDNMYRADNIEKSKYGFKFDVIKNGDFVINIEMHIPGIHNVMNGLAAFAVADYMGVESAGIKSALEKFTGAGRRFEFLGEFGGFRLADDYAHHPTELKATLSAAKSLDYNRVIAVFQPFTFSRTALLLDEFTDALKIADYVILTPIMGSREKNTYGVYSEDILKGLKNGVVKETFSDVADEIIRVAEKGDLVITMGGGDIYKAAHIVRDRFK